MRGTVRFVSATLPLLRVICVSTKKNVLFLMIGTTARSAKLILPQIRDFVTEDRLHSGNRFARTQTESRDKAFVPDLVIAMERRAAAFPVFRGITVRELP